MSPELDKQLCEDFPKIFAQRNGSPKETAFAFGFECGDGWYDLIAVLCCNIQAHLDYNADVPQVVAMQVKEKFGTLRFYVHGGDEYIIGTISMAESMSSCICEICGNKGKIRIDGWITTRCDSCHRVGEE
jgi:hypothetical protein